MDYSSKLDVDQTSGRNIGAVGLALMTKKLPVKTEVVDGGRWSIVAARPHLETGHEEWLRWRDPERQAVAGAHLQGREEAVGHLGHV